MDILDILILLGVPTAVTGLLVWFLKKHIDKIEKKRDERERNVEEFMLLIMQNTRATNVLAKATAKAVQRIPDAHCNGDMTYALEQAAKIQKDEKDFLINHGIKHVFEE